MLALERPVPSGSEVFRGFSAWSLTERLSPRPTVRVAAVDVAGETLNLYSSTARTSGPAPETTWAMYLTDAQHRFRFICFDLDAKDDVDQVEQDTITLTALLDAQQIEHIVCASGPTGGRHIWIALVDATGADTVAQLGRLAKALCPSLDTSPLANAATGCVRPPGAPHRKGGASTPITGELRTLEHPSTTTAMLHELTTAIAARVDVDDDGEQPTGPLPVDEHGHLYLPGAKRALPPFAAAALEDVDAALGDASVTLRRVLLGAAAARWRYADVLALLDTAPGLEHARTLSNAGTRIPRPARGPNSPARILGRQWHKAVRHIATTKRQGSDPTFDRRAGDVAAIAQAVQDRADASPGRWHRGGGPSDRRVLDVLCTLALQAVSARVEADTRRLALLAGIGRETARLALLRLAADGWIARAAEADGPHGAHWRIDPAAVIHKDTDSTWSQADPRPEGAGAAARTVLLNELSTRITRTRHDVFTPGRSLGLRTGNLYGRLSTTEVLTTDELALRTGSPVAWIRQRLRVLTETGLIESTPAGWISTNPTARTAVARALHVDGRLEDRARRYRAEREAWAWWQTELTWMSLPRQAKRRHRPGPGQVALLPVPGTSHYQAHPRRPDGRADFRTARAYAVAGSAANPSERESLSA